MRSIPRYRPLPAGMQTTAKSQSDIALVNQKAAAFAVGLLVPAPIRELKSPSLGRRLADWPIGRRHQCNRRGPAQAPTAAGISMPSTYQMARNGAASSLQYSEYARARLGSHQVQQLQRRTRGLLDGGPLQEHCTCTGDPGSSPLRSAMTRYRRSPTHSCSRRPLRRRCSSSRRRTASRPVLGSCPWRRLCIESNQQLTSLGRPTMPLRY